MRERILNKWLEIKVVRASNKFDFAVIVILTIMVVFVNVLFPNPQFPVISTINFFVLIGILYKLSQIVSLLKCLNPAIEHIENLVNGK